MQTDRPASEQGRLNGVVIVNDPAVQSSYPKIRIPNLQRTMPSEDDRRAIHVGEV